MQLKSSINIPQALLTAAIVTALVLVLLFVVCFEETDADGHVIGVSKPRLNFFK